MPDFETPFLNWTDDEVRTWGSEHTKGNGKFANSTFTILDEDTIKNKTSRIGYMGGSYPDKRMMLADFYAEMYVRVPMEVATMSWFEQGFVGTGEVYNREIIEKEERGEMVETKVKSSCRIKDGKPERRDIPPGKVLCEMPPLIFRNPGDPVTTGLVPKSESHCKYSEFHALSMLREEAK